MGKLSEMINSCRNFKKLPTEKLTINEDGECIKSLFETDWARILLIRNTDDPNSIGVEVEISLPKHVSRHDTTSAVEKPRKSLKNMIKHLEYLLSLEGYGFQLDLVGEDCLWTASKRFSEMLDENVFKALVPP